jgi:hypothetical protein
MSLLLSSSPMAQKIGVNGDRRALRGDGLIGEVKARRLLLLTLFGACEFLNNLTSFPSFNLFSRIFHEFREPAGQFVNAPRLPSLNRLGRNQFRANPDCCRTRQNEVSCVLLIHSSRRDQWNLRQGNVQRPDISFATERTTRKHLDEIGPSAPRSYHFRRR